MDRNVSGLYPLIYCAGDDPEEREKTDGLLRMVLFTVVGDDSLFDIRNDCVGDRFQRS